MNLRRLFVIASNVFREVLRDRVLYLVGLFALIMLLAGRLVPELSSLATSKVLLDLGLGAIALISLVVTVFVGSGLIHKEIEKRTVLVLLAKPMSRSEFVVGKHLGLSAVLALLIAAMGAIYFLLLRAYSVPFDIVPLSLSLVFLWLEQSLLAAVAMLFGSAMSPLLTTLLTFAIYAVGHLSPDLVKLAAIAENPGLQKAVRSLYLVVPDLDRLNLRNDAIYSNLPNAQGLGALALYAFVYIAFLLAGSTLIFQRREF